MNTMRLNMNGERGQGVVGAVLGLALLALVVLAVLGVSGEIRTTLARQATQRAEARVAQEHARTEGLRAAADLARVEADAEVSLLHAETIAYTVRHAVWRGDATFVALLGLGGSLIVGLSLLCMFLLRRKAYQTGPRYLEAAGRHALTEEAWIPAVFVNGAGVICERR